MTASCQQTVVSVGIPCYNRVEGLEATLECICGQSYPHLEIIISDNASPDPRVGELARAYQARDSRVKYIRQEQNIGPLPNFLYLADVAEGDYFMWAADDDWWAPEYVEETLKLLQSSPEAGVAFTRYAPIDNEFSISKKYPDFFKALRELSATGLYERMKLFIEQRDAYGKAHIIYGLFPLAILKGALAQTIENVNRVTDVYDLGQFDMLLNAAVLSKGHLVTSERLLRRFGSAPRKVSSRAERTIWERLLRYDGRTLDYYKCYEPLIDSIALDESGRRALHRIVRKRVRRFIWERVGRRLLVYKIYWHWVKKCQFKTVSELVRDGSSPSE